MCSGFSRGSASALLFLNRIAERARKRDPLFCQLQIRFVGLFDAVSSLRSHPGVRSADIMSGREGGFRVRFARQPELPEPAVHFIALDEQRREFQSLDVQGALQIGFRGVHLRRRG